MKLKTDQIERVCKQFNLSGLRRATPLSDGYANLNYRIDADQGVFLYRVCLQQTNEDHIHYEINLLQALRSHNFPTAYMIPSNEGHYLVETDHGKVLLYEFKHGHEPVLNPDTVAEIARALADLNSLPEWKKFPRQNVISIDVCSDLIPKLKHAPMQYPDIYSYFEEQTLFLKPWVMEVLPRGVIHGDCFPDNTIYQGNRLIAIIDFEEACSDHLLMDVGMAINGFCFINNDLDAMLMNTFLREYNQVRPLTDKERELLPYYIQWGAHGMLSWHLRHDLMFRENPKQLERVTELMNRVKRLRDKGIPATEV